MMPILVEKNCTSFPPQNNGLGVLSDAISMSVTEELNGMFELTFEYPVDGIHADEITTERIIIAPPGDGRSPQPFVIYRIEKVAQGRIRAYAEHYTYYANLIPVLPFNAGSVQSAAHELMWHQVLDQTLRLISFDVIGMTTVKDFSQEKPTNLKAGIIAIKEAYGGDLEYNNAGIILTARRGSDRHVTLNYGKNIIDIKQEQNISDMYNAILPYYQATDSEPILLEYDAYVLVRPLAEGEKLRPMILDLTRRVDEMLKADPPEEDEDPTPYIQTDLMTATVEYIQSHDLGYPKVSINVNFALLSQTEDYKNIATLENVVLGDTVNVYFEKLGISSTARVTKTVYDVLAKRYSSIDVGSERQTASAIIATREEETKTEIMDYMQEAIAHATALITGGLGGYVVFKYNAQGKPEELLILDENSGGVISQSQNIWRFNKNGWGFSKTGYDGPFFLAATLDGGIVATYITTGILRAGLIKAGRLQAMTGDSYWDMESGVFYLAANAKMGDSNTTLSDMKTTISANSRAITTEVSARQNADTQLGSRITQTANAITTEVSERKGADNALSSRITQEAGRITSEISARQSADTSLSSRIDQNATSISLKVSKGDVSSQIGIESGEVNLGTDRLIINSTNFKLNKDGDVELKGSMKAGGSVEGCRILGSTIGFVEQPGQTQPSTKYSYIDSTMIRTPCVAIYDGNGVHNGSWIAEELHYHRLTSGAPIRVGTEWKDYPSVFESGIYGVNIDGSDRRLKKNIRKLVVDKAKKFIMALVPKSYQYKKELHNPVRHGFIAQDVQKAVYDNWGIVSEAEGYLALTYHEFIPDLVAVVQDHEKRIAELETVIKELKGGRK